MQRPGIIANPPHRDLRPLKEFYDIASFILRVICAIFFIMLIHYCVTKDSLVRKVHVEQEITEENHVEQEVSDDYHQEQEVQKDCHEEQKKSEGSHEDDLAIQLKECQETAKLNDLMDIRKFRNRANIYECQVACLYPVAEPNLYESLKQYIHSTPKLNPEDPQILIHDVSRDQTSNWKFDPQLTILHFEFNKRVLPEAVIFEYSSDLRDLFKAQELRVKLIGIIHNSEESILKTQQKIGVFVKQIEIDDYLFEEKDEFSRYYENIEQTTMARIINYNSEVQYFNAIRIEIYSSSNGLSDVDIKGFSFSRIKIMEVQ